MDEKIKKLDLLRQQGKIDEAKYQQILGKLQGGGSFSEYPGTYQQQQGKRGGVSPSTFGDRSSTFQAQHSFSTVSDIGGGPQHQQQQHPHHQQQQLNTGGPSQMI